MKQRKIDATWPYKLYAHPHDGITDIFRDKGMTCFYCKDPWMQYRKSKARLFNGFWFWVEIVR